VADLQKARILVIGVGNSFRADDAAGLLAARRLKGAGLDSAAVIEHSGEGASLMDTWKDADAVVLIDAVSSGSIPGSIYRMESASSPLPANMFQSSTHAFSLPHAIEMSRALGILPSTVIIFGIEGKTFQAGTELSHEVDEALPELVRRVAEEVKALRRALAKGD
jgi:hydrogenase maturation protease